MGFVVAGLGRAMGSGELSLMDGEGFERRMVWSSGEKGSALGEALEEAGGLEEVMDLI